MKNTHFEILLSVDVVVIGEGDLESLPPVVGRIVSLIMCSVLLKKDPGTALDYPRYIMFIF